MSPSPSHRPSWEDALFRERVRQAMAMSPGDKLVEGIRLFEQECEASRVEIRAAFPELDEAGVEQELQRRLDEQRRLEEKDIYRPLAIEDLDSSP